MDLAESEIAAKLVIVEDDPVMVEGLRMQLEDLHHEVIGSTDTGQKAITMVDALRPDLVLMDIILNGPMDGIETAERIRRLYGIPVVFVTAYSDDVMIERAKRIDPFGYILKPVRAGELNAVVSMALYRHRLEKLLQNLRWGANVCDHLSDAIFALDREKRIAFLNQAAERLCGSNSGDLLGSKWHKDILPLQENSTFDIHEYLTHVLESGETKYFDDKFHLRLDDQERIVTLQIVPIRTGDEPTMGTALVAADVTRQATSDARLKSEQEFSSAILDTIDSVVVVMNREGEIIRFNAAAQQLTGYTESECLGRHVWDFLLLPEESPGVAEVFSRLTAGHFPSRHTNKWVTRDHKECTISWSNSALLDAGGTVEFIIATGIDITEQLQTKFLLARAEMEWNEVIDYYHDAIYILGLDDILIKANQRFFQMINKQPEEVLGKNIVDIMHPHGETTPCPVCQARIAKKDATIILEADYPDNLMNIPVQITVRVIRDPKGMELAILMGMRDLTEQRNIEDELRIHRDHLEEMVEARTSALENANRELEAFSYSVSHDLRAPLRSIDGFSLAVLDECGDKLDENEKDYLHRVRRATQRMGQLIDDLLELSRVGRDKILDETVNLSKLAKGVLKELQENEPERQIDFEIVDNLNVRGDARLLRLVLQNLLGNSWKFTAQKPTARISVRQQVDAQGQPIIIIEDNGIGFDMSYANKLFGVFQRLHSDPEFVGTGIGLATVQRIIHRHHGTVWAESEVGKGSRFYFTLGKNTKCIT